jgi:uncharacterized protein YndB with AHSA1/START domain
MTTVERTTTIPASPQQVWDVLADFAAIGSWAPNVDHSCLLTEQESGLGTVRRIQTGRTTIVETVTAWEPGVMLSYSITGLPAVIRSVISTWRLEPYGGGASTTLTTAIDCGPRPPQKLIAKAVGRKLGQPSDEMLAGLTAHLQETSS